MVPLTIHAAMPIRRYDWGKTATTLPEVPVGTTARQKLTVQKASVATEPEISVAATPPMVTLDGAAEPELT